MTRINILFLCTGISPDTVMEIDTKVSRANTDILCTSLWSGRHEICLPSKPWVSHGVMPCWTISLYAWVFKPQLGLKTEDKAISRNCDWTLFFPFHIRHCPSALFFLMIVLYHVCIYPKFSSQSSRGQKGKLDRGARTLQCSIDVRNWGGNLLPIFDLVFIIQCKGLAPFDKLRPILDPLYVS